jgi:hypothetical protein
MYATALAHEEAAATSQVFIDDPPDALDELIRLAWLYPFHSSQETS